MFEGKNPNIIENHPGSPTTMFYIGWFTNFTIFDYVSFLSSFQKEATSNFQMDHLHRHRPPPFKKYGLKEGLIKGKTNPRDPIISWEW